MRKLLALWAAIFIAAHLPFLPPSLADLDSINFAFAVRDFDVTKHQPHPPGSPLYVGVTKAATAALHRAGDPLNVPHALALVNTVGAALALAGIFWLGRVIGYAPRAALAASLVAGTVPLFWFTASRPLSDLAGLAVAVAAQALLARAWLTGGSRHAIAGVFVACAGIGFRLQTAALTLPLAAIMLLSRRVPPRGRGLAIGAGVLGVLTWAVPLLIDTGAGEYVRALMAQGREDFTGVEMLATQPSLRLLRDALYETFVDPFGSPILAAIVLGVAAIGAAIAAVRDRPALSVLAIGYVPYVIFHLLFQETITNRYAIPLIPPIALLFVLPFERLATRLVLPAAAGAAIAGLAIAIPALQAYAGAESPGFAVIRDLHRLPRVNETVLAMHQRIAMDLHRHQAWEPIPPMRTLPPTVDYEWLELVKLWQEGYEGPIWFLADPKRTDLRLIDPQRRRLLRQYGWPERDVPFVGGIRPNRIDWYFIQRPGWFLGRGWALSPEIGGLTARDRMGPGEAPAVAWVRRRGLPSSMLLGGRHLGAAADPPIVVRVRLDGRQIDEWPIRPGGFVFMRPVLPEEIAGDGTYGRLEIEASWDGSGPAPLSLEQFDFQGIDGSLVAYDEGWWEPEYSERTGATWRWTSGESKLWLFNPGRDLTLVISGENPSRYYGGGAEMTVLAGDTELARFTLDTDFTRSVTIPVEPLSVARGRVTLRLSKTHVPGRLRVSPDQRELGVRIYDVSVY